MYRKFVRVIGVFNPNQKTVDALMKLDLPNKVSVEVSLDESADKSRPKILIKLSSVDSELLKISSKNISSTAESTGAVVKIIKEKRITAMKSKLKNKILVSFYQSNEKYERLAHEIRRLFRTDPGFPEDSTYTIKHRIKGEERLIEKINEENKKRESTSLIDSKNYQDKINDILGMRVVCFRRSDVEKVEKYFRSLKEEKKLNFVRKPEKKQPPFLWIQNPKEKLPKLKDLQYSGYSSIHYVIKPGKGFKLPKELSSLRCEIQVRTILEEAWGEIDHKYRYEIKRKGVDIPSAIDRGFRAFSAYLQAASVQAEYLCRDVDAFLIQLQAPKRPRRIKPTITPPSAPLLAEPKTIAEVLKQKVGFTPTDRTVAYVERRIYDTAVYYGYMFDDEFFSNLPKILNEKLITEEVREIFKQIYMEVMEKEPFVNPSDRDVDLLNLVNYSLFQLVQTQNTAQEGLRSVLKKRISY